MEREMLRPNMRKQRADELTHAILRTIRPFIDGDREEDIYRALDDLLEKHGAEIVTDYTRKEAGLPPRGPDGWTVEEMMALEKRRLELLYAPLSLTVPKASIDAALKEHEGEKE